MDNGLEVSSKWMFELWMFNLLVCVFGRWLMYVSRGGK